MCIMAYCDETYTMIPTQKSHRNGIAVLIYGAIVTYIGLLTIKGKMELVLGMSMMPLAHELLFMIDNYLEKEPYIYNFPKKGVRVLEVSPNQTYVNRIERGDIVLKINGKDVLDEDSYYKAIEDKNLIIILKDLYGNRKILHFNKREYEKLEVIILPKE